MSLGHDILSPQCPVLGPRSLVPGPWSPGPLFSPSHAMVTSGKVNFGMNLDSHTVFGQTIIQLGDSNSSGPRVSVQKSSV